MCVFSLYVFAFVHLQGQLLMQETNEHNVQLEKECKHLASKLHTSEMTNKDLQEDNLALQQRIANLERKQVSCN